MKHCDRKYLKQQEASLRGAVALSSKRCLSARGITLRSTTDAAALHVWWHCCRGFDAMTRLQEAAVDLRPRAHPHRERITAPNHSTPTHLCLIISINYELILISLCCFGCYLYDLIVFVLFFIINILLHYFH